MINSQVAVTAAVDTPVSISFEYRISPHPLSIAAFEDNHVVEIVTGGLHDDYFLVVLPLAPCRPRFFFGDSATILPFFL